MSPLRCFVFLSLSLFTFVGPASAHVADTSFLRIQVLPKALVIDLNVDLLTLQKVTPLDVNGDGKVDRVELSQAAPVIERYFRDTLRLIVGDEPPDLGRAKAPEWQAEQDASAEAQLQDSHVNLHFERPMPEGQRAFSLSVDVFKALGAAHNMIVAMVQGGNSQQTVLTAELPVLAYDPIVAGEGGGGQFSNLEMVKLGLEHILTGTDHLLFLLTLLVMVGSWGQVLGIVTSFTIAHSVTVGLATFEIIRLPEKLINCGIAASIVWVAGENLLRGQGKKRWLLTFGFGLVHGFGFAGAVSQMNLPREGLLKCLVLFNGGIEIGQLMLVVPVLPLIFWIRRTSWALPVQRLVSASSLLLALVWLGERLWA